MAEVTFEKGLPSNLDVERFILGSILLDSENYIQVASVVAPDDFSLESNRRIFASMIVLAERGVCIDRVTLAEELMRVNKLESIGGLSYLVDLDAGMPRLANIKSYVDILKEKSQLRKLIFAGQKLIDSAMLEADSASTIASSAEDSILSITETSTENQGKTIEKIVDTFPGGIQAFLDASRRKRGLQTGFRNFDDLTGGLHPGDLFILAGRPSMGKTAMAVNIGQYAASKEDAVVSVFSLEMSDSSLLNRMVCSEARVDSMKFALGFLSREEKSRLLGALSYLETLAFLIDDTGAITVAEIFAKCRSQKKLYGRLDLIIIDYIQLMGSTGKEENRNQVVSKISRGLKLMAKALGVPVMALSQLSRATETRRGDFRPQLSDLRDSGSLEQDADLVGFVFREEVYKPDREDLKGIAQLILAKQRNGPTGIVNLAFLKQYTKFENLARWDEEPEGTAPPPSEDQSSSVQ